MRNLGPLIAIVLLVLCWQVLSAVVANSGLPSPGETFGRFVTMPQEPDFWQHADQTGRAFAASAVISLLAGVSLGIIFGMNRTSGLVAEPLLVNLYSLPKVTLYPVVLLIFGLGISARIAFGVMHGVIPLVLFTMNAIRQMKPVYRRSAQTMGLTRPQIAVWVVLPAILPQVLTGARLGLSLSLLGVLIGEMFASRNGLGAMVTRAMERGDMPTVLAVALVLGAVALFVNSVLLAAENKIRH